MWFGILTPGAHPSRPVPTVGDVTLYAWTSRARMRIDGPAAAVDAGVFALRAKAAGSGERMGPPRCFVCREPCLVPDAAAARAAAIDASPDDGGFGRLPPEAECREAALAAAEEVRGGSATLLFVHVEDLVPGGPPPAREEESLVILPDRMAALLVPLAALPGMLPLAESLAGEEPLPACGRCGTVLPAGRAERDAADAVPRRVARSTRRPPARRGGRHAA